MMEFRYFLGTLTFLALIVNSIGLYEDQVGKFDWHQKYFGKIQFLVTDPNQPRRVFVGTETNIIGSINANTGKILYRHLLEPNGKLLYLGELMEKYLVSISTLDNVVKIRTYIMSSGIQSEEYAVGADKVNHATEISGSFYLLNQKASQLSITTVLPTTSNKDEDGKEQVVDQKSDKIETKILQLEFEPDICQIVSKYMVCAKNNRLVIIKISEKTTTYLALADLTQDIEKIVSSTPGKLSAFAIRGNGFTRVFGIKEENNKIELAGVPLKSKSLELSMTQTTSDDEPILFVAATSSERNRDIDVYAFDSKFQPFDGKNFQIRNKLSIFGLQLTKSYCVNSRCGLVGFTSDEVLFGTKPVASSSRLEIEWTRQEALADVIAVEMVDYPSELGPSWNPYRSQSDVFTAFFSRIKFELETILTGERLYSVQDRFGLQKAIVFVSSIGKVIGMDNISGSILYTFMLPEFKAFADKSVNLYLQRPAKYSPLKPQAVVMYPSKDSTVIFAFNPIDGKPLAEPATYPKILQSLILLEAKEETKFLKPILMLDANGVVHSFPSNLPSGIIRNVHFFVVNKNSLAGYGVIQNGQRLDSKLLWDLNAGSPTESIGVYGKLPGERVHSQGRVLPDRSVSYKYMNPNLVVLVVTDHEATNINIIMMDAITGNVVHSFWHKKCKGPVNVVHSENWIVYSLFNEKSRRFEINSVELYEGTTQSNSTTFSSFAAPPIQPIVVKQSFIFPTGIRFMTHTRTEKGITNKDILIALPSGGILELPRMILQPRLSQQHYVQQVQDDDGPIQSVPYIPELPIPSEMIINYNQSVARVTGIKAWPTRLESTCLILVYGNDLFFTRVMPSKTFDALNDDFDFLFITLVLFGLCVGAYVTKRFSAKKKLEQAWR